MKKTSETPLEAAMIQLTKACWPGPYSMHQPSCEEAAVTIFKELKHKNEVGITKEAVIDLAVKNGWDRESAELLAKKVKKYMNK